MRSFDLVGQGSVLTIRYLSACGCSPHFESCSDTTTECFCHTFSPIFSPIRSDLHRQRPEAAQDYDEHGV